MTNIKKPVCATLPKPAAVFLQKLANNDLTNIQKNCDSIHELYDLFTSKKVSKKEFSTQVSSLLRSSHGFIQELSNLNIAFPSLFSEDQTTALNDLIELSKIVNLQNPDIENFTDYENGQIGGAAAIIQQQWNL